MSDKPAPKRKYIQKQPAMTRVLLAVLPAVLGSIYFFGWRALVVILTCIITAILTEGAFQWRKNKPVTMAAAVTGLLLAMTLPPSMPLWMAAAGTVFAIVFGKMAFGGMGTNIFNPALVGRCFLYLAFPVAMTAGWMVPGTKASMAGGLMKWGTDAVSGATPLDLYKAGEPVEYLNLFLGNVSGSLGETSAVLILLGALYLLITKTASWQTMAGCVLGAAGLSGILHWTDPSAVGNALFQLLAGGFMFGIVFMATDPVSSAKTKPGKWLYGIGIGLLVITLRGYSNFSCGVMFAILLMNMLNPLIDIAVKEWQASRKKNKTAAEDA